MERGGVPDSEITEILGKISSAPKKYLAIRLEYFTYCASKHAFFQ